MIAIIGGGISGLTLAYYLQNNGVDYQVYEKSDKVGGFIRSEKVDNYWLEYGPNSLLCGEEVAKFLKEIGLQDQIVEANDVSKSRYIVRNHNLTKLPTSPPSLLFGSFFSWSTKRKIFKERKVKPTNEFSDETLTEFIERHFGKDVVEYLLKPFIAGIYAGDPDQLVAKYAFPKLKEYEEQYGSILKGLIKNKGGARRKTVSFKEGMQQLPNSIASKLQHVQVAKKLDRIVRSENDYTLQFEDGSTETASKVVFASSPYDMQSVLAENYDLDIFSQLKTPSIAAVHTVFKKSDLGVELKGFGALNPKIENLYTAGTIWSSVVFDGKAPEDEVLLSTFVGGMQYAGNDSVSENEIMQKVTKELKQIYKANNDPVFQKVTKWKKSIPQYGKEMKEVLALIELLEKDNIFVCSNWNKGISLEDCIKNAKALAQRLSKN